MKISEMTNDQACDCLLRLTPAVSAILEDGEVQTMLNMYSEGRKKPLYQMLSEILPKLVPFCVKTHKADLYEIVGALTFKKAKDVGAMNILETMKVLKESIDGELIGFFKPSGRATEQPGTES